MHSAEPAWPSAAREPGYRPTVLPVRSRAAVVREVLAERLASVLPAAMREAGIDMWLVICQEDDLDPVFTTLMPMDTWCPILQILVFHDQGEADGVDCINLSMTNTGGLYEKPWRGTDHHEQWQQLAALIADRNPGRIGINTGSVQWAAGGLTHNLRGQLVDAIGETASGRLVSAEPLVTRWLATLTERQIELYEHVGRVAHTMLHDCYSRSTIVPGVTTVEDLEWAYWQMAADQGLDIAFKPFFNLVRSDEAWETHGREDRVIRPGDFIHSDVGIKYLRLNSDHQHWCYVRRPGELAAPDGMCGLLAQANRLQDVFMGAFEAGRTGNELLSAILQRARRERISNPKVYSHSLGLFLHEPGPLIGLPWEQEACPGRGDVPLRENYAFTMELSVRDAVPEWGGQEVTLSIEEDVLFDGRRCRPVDGRQTAFYLV
jgi:Xaa-Pro aminopeptidase